MTISLLWDKMRSYWFLLIICLLGGGFYYTYYVDRAAVELEIEVEHRTFFRIYWADSGEPFSEARHARVLVSPGQSRYHFFLTDLEHVAQLRIDPHDYQGKSVVRHLSISQRGFQTLRLGENEFEQVVGLAQIERMNTEEGELLVISSGTDPQLLYDVSLHPEANGWGMEMLRVVLLVFLLLFAGCLSASLVPGKRYIPFSLGMVVVLALVMAVLSRQNVHPDENVHIAATEYYQHNWLPPDVSTDEINHTYSKYGISRLNGREVYYLLAGKFTALIEPLHLDERVGYRVFNVALLALLLLVSIRYRASRLLIGVLLISPQLWYVFSYCNSDAFSLFCALLAGWQAVDRRSYLYRFLLKESDNRLAWTTGLLMLGVSAGLLLMLKKNYLPLLGFLLLYVLHNVWLMREEESFKRIALRLLGLIVIGFLFYGVRVGVDYQVNGLDRQQKINEIQMSLADPMFNPATEVDKRHVYLSMKERGVSLAKVIHIHRWAEKTFRSAFGVYGYMTVSATHVFYDLVRWTVTGLFCFIVGSVLVFGSWPARIQLFSALFFSAALIGASLHHSWTADFQAQGRYLFPVAVMLAVATAGAEHYLHRKTFCALIVALFALSCYSFIGIGLQGIPKVVL